MHFKSVITDADMNELYQAKRFGRCEMMISRIVVSDGDRKIVMKIVPSCSHRTSDEKNDRSDDVKCNTDNDSQSSEDSVDKHTRYVANGYTSIDSSDEAIATSDTFKDGSVKDGSVKDGIVKASIVNNDSVNDGSVKDDTVKDGSVIDDNVKDDSVKDDSVNNDSVNNDSVTI